MSNLGSGNLNKNPNYLMSIELHNNQNNLPTNFVLANIPEDIVVGAQAQWHQRMSSSASQAVDALPNILAAERTVAQNVISTFNLNAVEQAFTYQTWQGTSSIEMDFIILFNSYNSAFTDVVGPMSMLQSWVMPSRLGSTGVSNSILIPPGPSAVRPYLNRISVRIGRLLYWNSCIITSCQNTFDGRMDASGQPISGRCDLRIATINTPGRDDLLNAYGTAKQGFDVGNDYGTRSVLGSSLSF